MRKYNNFDLHFIFERKNEEICFLHAEYVHPLKQELVEWNCLYQIYRRQLKT
ncbi:MAG: hypothetical protein HFI41_07255 [Lachnospiraceae bacterium]|nr:hypothetical protein [Lachnospiraceae bacterium]